MPKPAPKPQEPPRKPRKTPKGAATAGYNLPLTAEQRAKIWTLTEEQLSQREVARQLGLAPGTVGRELAKDPIGLESLRARQREDRAKRWRRIEDMGLDETIGWLERISKIRTGQNRMSKRAMAEMPLVPRFLQSVRAAAETATKQVQLLTGGATERVEGQGGGNDSDAMTPEQLIEQAIELDAIQMLPPRLRAQALLEKRKRETEG